MLHVSDNFHAGHSFAWLASNAKRRFDTGFKRGRQLIRRRPDRPFCFIMANGTRRAQWRPGLGRPCRLTARCPGNSCRGFRVLQDVGLRTRPSRTKCGASIRLQTTKSINRRPCHRWLFTRAALRISSTFPVNRIRQATSTGWRAQPQLRRRSAQLPLGCGLRRSPTACPR